jgi:DNA-binding CsgD family transcriptional regulator
VLIAPLSGIAWLLGEIGDPDDTRTYAQALLTRSVECADIGGAFTAHMRLACAAWKLNDLAQARAEFIAARDVWPPTANIALCGAALDRGRMELAIGDIAEAEAAFRAALEHGRRAGTLSMLGRAASFLGLVLHEQGKLHEAVTHACAALDFFDRCGEVARSQDCIRFFAELALRLHRAHDGVSLIAYAATIPKYHASRTIDDALLAPYRAALPDPAFSEAWAVGAQLTFAEARRVAEQIAATHQQPGAKATKALQHPLLSPREVEVVRLLAAGKTNRAIAEGLLVSESTIEKHVHHAMTRLDLSSRTALVAWAVRNDIT